MTGSEESPGGTPGGELKPPRRATPRLWLTALCFALPIEALVVALIYLWFGVLDRYQIFLYFHEMGPGFDTSPFGWVTVSRYWMSGLVASGAVLVLYTLALFLLGRIRRNFEPPRWWRVWLLCALPLAVTIPAIVMTVNEPTLPPLQATQVTATTLLGLALALILGRLAALRPRDYGLLMADGLGLACLFMSLKELESLSGWLGRGRTGALVRMGLIAVLGLGLFLIMTVLRWWRRWPAPRSVDWYVAGLQVHYLLLPLYHLAWCSDTGSWTDPGYFIYISDSDNYFARSTPLQVGVWIGVALLVLGVTRVRSWLEQRPARGDGNPARRRL